MARKNTKAKADPTLITHEGAPAKRIDAEAQLRRSVMSCFLFEKEFYEDGEKIAERILRLAAEISPAIVAALAIEAREQGKLRHVPLLLLVSLIKHGSGTQLVSKTIARVIQRADELAELVALYWELNPKRKDGKNAPLSAQMKLGLAEALGKFDAYQLGKYNRDYAVKLRDVLFLAHAKAKDPEHDALLKKVVSNTLEAPDTWEVELSAGKGKKETFTRLIAERKLGDLALIRNLRNMEQAGVDDDVVLDALERARFDRILPFRFVAAARHAPKYEPALDKGMLKAIEALPKLKGKTIVLVDVSGSMEARLSGKSDLKRIDAAAALASVVNAEKLEVFSFSNEVKRVPARRGMAGIEAVVYSQPHVGTELGKAVNAMNREGYDRLIVVTDEQSHDRVSDPKGKGYMINVGSYQNGVGYGKWVHIDGFSENVLRFIHEIENQD